MRKMRTFIKSFILITVSVLILSPAIDGHASVQQSPLIEIIVIAGITYQYIYNTDGQLVDIIVIDEN